MRDICSGLRCINESDNDRKYITETNKFYICYINWCFVWKAIRNINEAT